MQRNFNLILYIYYQVKIKEIFFKVQQKLRLVEKFLDHIPFEKYIGSCDGKIPLALFSGVITYHYEALMLNFKVERNFLIKKKIWSLIQNENKSKYLFKKKHDYKILNFWFCRVYLFSLWRRPTIIS